MSKRKNAPESAGVADIGAGVAPAEMSPDVGAPVSGSSVPLLPNGPAEVAESKSARFVRLANRRVPNALKAIGYVRNLASRASYDFTPEQSDKIMSALASAVQDTARAFDGAASRQEGWSL